MKIAAIVFNSVRNDNRVIREALSLSECGHEVSILGVRDSRASLPIEQLAPRCRVIRVPFRAREQRFLAIFWLVVSTIPALAVALLIVRSLGVPENALATAMVSGATRTLAFVTTYSDRAILVIIALLLLGRGLRRAGAAHRHYRNYSSIEGEPIPPGRLKRIRLSFRAIRIILGREVRLRFIRNAVFAELDQMQPDVLHCHDLLTLPMGVRYKARKPCILVYDSHEIFEEVASSSPLLRFYYRRLQSRCSGAVDAFITVNDSVAEFLGRRYEHLPKAVVVKNAADPAASDSHQEYDGRLHEAVGLERDQRILLYQGGFSPHRGLEHLVGAASRLPPGWRILLMGWGKLEARLRRQAQIEDPLGDRVFFLPPVPPDELLLWSKGATLGIIPYEDSCLNHRFCTPNKLWEYPVAGVPLLVSPLPELTKAVTAHDIGWILEPYTCAETIAACVSRVSDDELCRKRRNCEAFVLEDNWEIYKRRLTDLYAGFSPHDTSEAPC